MNLRHRHALPLTRPAVLLGEGRPDTRERRKSSLQSGRHIGNNHSAYSREIALWDTTCRLARQYKWFYTTY